MASLCKKTTGQRYIQFASGELVGNKGRPKISLGKMAKNDAEYHKRHIEALVRSK